ncbi:MAG TPA: ribosomal RNA small subunit methyltransferase A [Candidatus Portnoybacteria bacterium]|nr:ribosomal RNA small subunit methyltransferase A [Candidatus Portnoybacteria bacterium]
MNLTSKSTIRHLLKKYNLRPSKYLGQYFLIDQKRLQQIIEAANLSQADLVIEIGPGLGVLTQELAKRVKKVVAIEKDLQMVKVLEEIFKDFKNIEIIKQDILKASDFLPRIPYKVVANLPYYLTSPVIRMFLELKHRPSQMVLLVQKEVAQRICAKPGQMSLLSVAVQFYGKPAIVNFISKKSFWPRPGVDSAILKIKTVKKLPLSVKPEFFFRVVKAGFSAKRKQLINSLSAGLHLSKDKTKEILKKARIDSKRRAESLSLKEWQKIVNNLTNN